MPEAAITIGIPGAGASDFAAAPIPSIVLVDCWTEENGAPMRSRLADVEVTGRSSYGTPQIGGPSYGPIYSWPVVAMVTKAQARQIGALVGWQNQEYLAERDGALRLIDEVEELDSEPSPHSRTLLSAIAEDWSGSYVYGYGVFKVKIQLPPEWRQFLGRWTDSGEEARLVSFRLEEV